MSSILVIGCVSLDTIHIEQNDERKTFNTIGGAGLFTALAASHAGAEVTLYAPKPSPMPQDLVAVDKAVNWIGPQVNPDDMPTLEIAHHGQGRATLIGASWGPEKLLVPESLDHEARLSDKGKGMYDIVHIAALSTPRRQLEFLRFFSGDRTCGLISVGTYARAISSDRETVLQMLDECTVFFMNSNEAALLFQGGEVAPKNNQFFFVTDGRNGATVYSSTYTTGSKTGSMANGSERFAKHITASPANELDPTGAGDTFCGATLAALSKVKDAIAAASFGAELAARTIEHPGSAFYFGHPL
jgi:sugar/nucleoside kinase (ribokinase family)